MNAAQDRSARRKQELAKRRKTGRAAAVRARKKRQRMVMRTAGLGVFVLSIAAVALIVVSAGKADEPPPEASHDVRVDAHDFKFSPRPLLGLAGEVTVTMSNKGITGHDMVILKQGIRISRANQFNDSMKVGKIESLAPGYDASVTVDLEPGTYQVVCILPNHLEQGMAVDLVVS